jgi:hypothetical protein
MAIKYRAFWEALVISAFIFGLGFVFGIILENSRNQELNYFYSQSETDLLDAQILSSSLGQDNYNCEQAIAKNIEFGDKSYYDSITLDEYAGSSQLSNQVDSQHRKYDLLRTIFWINSIQLTEKCGRRFHTVVYLYDYNTDSVSEGNKQQVFSRYLTEIKKEFGSEVVLIPIAKNMDLYSLDLLMEKYAINSTAIILDERYVFDTPEEVVALQEQLYSQRISIPLN